MTRRRWILILMPGLLCLGACARPMVAQEVKQPPSWTLPYYHDIEQAALRDPLICNLLLISTKLDPTSLNIVAAQIGIQLWEAGRREDAEQVLEVLSAGWAVQPRLARLAHARFLKSGGKAAVDIMELKLSVSRSEIEWEPEELGWDANRFFAYGSPGRAEDILKELESFLQGKPSSRSRTEALALAAAVYDRMEQKDKAYEAGLILVEISDLNQAQYDKSIRELLSRLVDRIHVMQDIRTARPGEMEN